MAIRRRRGVSYSDSISPLWSWLLGAAVLVGIGWGVFYAIGKVNTHAESQIGGTDPLKARTKRKPAGASSTPVETTRKGVAPPVETPRRSLMERAAGDLNASVLAREACRLRGDRAGVERHLADANRARQRLEEVGEGGALPEHLEPGDEVVQFMDADLTRMSPDVAGDHLARAARAIAPGTSYKVRVKRLGGATQDLYLYFPHTATADVAAGDRVKISNEVAQELQQQVLSLPPDKLFADDRRKIERLLGQGTATAEEYAFLIRLLAKDGAGQLFDEKESFQTQIAALEKMLPTAPVPDAVLTKESHRIPGRITGDTPSTLTIETVLLSLTLPKEEVQVVYTAKELREEFDRRLKTALSRSEAFPQLLLWCRDWAMPVHQELVAYHMMQVDRNDRQARLAAKFYSAGDGKWNTRGNIATTGVVPAAARPETRADIRPLLEAYGFSESGGRWFKRQRWSAGIDSLHEPGSFPIKMQGLSIVPWREDDTPLSRDESIRGRKTSNAPPRLRFLAPTATQGVVTLVVEAPHVLADCQLRAVGGILERGHAARLEVLLTPDGAKSTTLYAIEDGGNDAWHDISGHVAGKKRFTVTARLWTTKDSYHMYTRFLSSLPDSKQVFWARGTILVPALEADRVWLGARP
jgi:hypothetical protein